LSLALGFGIGVDCSQISGRNVSISADESGCESRLKSAALADRLKSVANKKVATRRLALAIFSVRFMRRDWQTRALSSSEALGALAPWRFNLDP
jgi:hypothetical protein